MRAPVWRTLVAALVALGLAACDSTPVLFPNAESLEFVDAGSAYQGEVGLPLLPAPTIRLVDGAGNPAPGVTVELEVAGGGGALGRTTRVSDREGVVRLDDWTLGQQAGPNELRVRIRPRGAGSAGAATSSFSLDAVGVPGPPAVVEALGGDGAPLPPLEGQVGEELDPVLRFRVLDRFQNPVPGAGLLADFLGSEGSLDATTATTDASGEAQLGRWTLGPTAGIQRLRVAATGTAGVSVELQATATPGPPASLEIQGDLWDQGTAGAVLAGQGFVVALDAFGNPVPGVTVQVTPDGAPAAAGSVESSQVTTGADGRALLPEWTLGTQAGPQRLRLTVPAAPGVTAAVLEVLVMAAPPAVLEAVSPTQLVGVQGSPVDPRPAVRVSDAFGNPVAGVQVTFAPAPGSPGPVGTLSGTTPTTNVAGEARLGAWQLPGLPGTAQVEARIPELPSASVVFTVQVTTPNRTLELLSGGNQEGETGTPVPAPVVVRLTDASGTPLVGVPIELLVIEGGGSVSPATVTTNGQGQATVTGWVLGPELGENRLQLSAPGTQSLVVLATATSDPPPPPAVWTIDAVHINQGNQTFEGAIPLVADRGGLLRVFLRGSIPSDAGVQVRIRMRLGSGVLLDETVSRGGGGGIVDTASDPDDLDASWNVTVPAALVQPGVELQVAVDPGGVLGLPPGGAPTWPVGGGWGSLQVVTLPTFRATFLPVESTYYGLTGRITPGNQGEYVTETLDSFPVSAFDFQVRTTPLVYDGSFENASAGWNGLLQDVRDLRLAEGAIDRYYHGILQRPAGPGIAGLAYIATVPEGIANLAAVSFDQLPAADEVIAHEFGHNFGRRHAPCGNPSGIDPGFPHPNGGLGNPGYSLARDALRPTTEFRDTMGYCFPMWTSDYTWGSILAMRALRPVGGPPVAASAGSPMSFAAAVGLAASATPAGGLLVGGAWSASETPVLRTPIPLEAPATPQDPSGEVRVELLDAGGRVVASGRYPAAPIDHADDPTLRHFGAVLPLPTGGAADGGVAGVRVTTPGGVVQWSGVDRTGALAQSPAPGGANPAAVVVTRLSGTAGLARDAVGGGQGAAQGGSNGEALRIQWDAERWPVLVLTDPSTGRIRGFLRSGDAVVQSGRRVEDFGFTVTDGLGSYLVQPEIR